ncbi:hypothetical protein LIER_32099 [Lithospermum erythrorhizon]|uniref:Polyprotein n=1 Tax=Lithospermum erythrorhizon TaxID=34254 RepID=A0AAV3RYU9_LITER
MEDAKSTPTHFPSDWSAYNSDSPQMADPSIYKRLVGRLLYLSFTRLDVTFAVNHLSQFMQASFEDNWKTATHIVKYPRGSTAHGLIYGSGSTMTIQAYYDTDWAKCPITRKSVSSYCIMNGFINPYHVPSNIQLADVFTKSLPAPLMFSLLSKMDFGSLHPS